MLNRILSLVLAGFVLAGAFALPTRAQDGPAQIRTMLEQRDQQIKALLGTRKTFTDDQRAQLKRVINDVIDFEAMGRAALGPHWGKLTEAQRTNFVNVFSEIVRAQSLSDLDIYRTNVTYGKITVDGDSAHVLTTVTYKDTPTKVEYALGYRDGTWRVDDIILDDVSTTAGYARSFQSVVRKKGFDALMTSLQKKLDQVTASK